MVGGSLLLWLPAFAAVLILRPVTIARRDRDFAIAGFASWAVFFLPIASVTVMTVAGALGAFTVWGAARITGAVGRGAS